MILIIILLFTSQVEEKSFSENIFSENIEYCQNVYITWKNPLNEKCDFEEVKKSLFINL